MRSSGPVLVSRDREETITRDEPRLSRVPGRRIALYGDGANLEEMLTQYRADSVDGFTTNPTLMRRAGVTDYPAFAKAILAEIRDIPVSFEVFADEIDEMERQAHLIASWGQNVYVKIPVTNTRGVSTASLVTRLSRHDVKLNVTALLTLDQVRAVTDALSSETPAIVSVFAGRIADTGVDPLPIMKESLRILRKRPLARLLWASPREVLNLYQAEEIGCHIVTMTKTLIDKVAMHGKDLTDLSRDTVQMFYDDAQRAGYTL